VLDLAQLRLPCVIAVHQRLLIRFQVLRRALEVDSFGRSAAAQVIATARGTFNPDGAGDVAVPWDPVGTPQDDGKAPEGANPPGEGSGPSSGSPTEL
jgi:hypothetical protein